VAGNVLTALRDPIGLRGYQHTVSLSVGVTVSSPRHAHADEVLRDADQALRRAKRQGRARVEFYDPTQDRPATVADLDSSTRCARRWPTAPAWCPTSSPSSASTPTRRWATRR